MKPTPLLMFPKLPGPDPEAREEARRTLNMG